MVNKHTQGPAYSGLRVGSKSDMQNMSCNPQGALSKAAGCNLWAAEGELADASTGLLHDSHRTSGGVY